MANGFLGAVHYQRNNLVAAERCFTLLNNSVHKVNKIWYTQGMLAQAKIYQIQGKPERAYETVEEARANLLGLQSSQLLSLLEGFLVDMNLNESHLAEANRWAKQYNPLPIMWMHRFYVPQFTLVKVWLAQDTEASREQTADLLAQLQAFYERTHNTRHLIEVLALQGLLERALGHKMAALDKLEQAVQLAELGGFIRLFVDLGPKIADLLKQLYSRDVTKDYLTQILAAFPPDSRLEEEKIANRKPVLSEAEVSEISQMPKRVQNLIEPLTERELEVLALLAQQFSNKEIADQLVIAPGTVKQHTHRIYQKLDVKSRWQAVEKAAELQLLSLN
jgi:LuxR family maltose regulon positive regulatory protein